VALPDNPYQPPEASAPPPPPSRVPGWMAIGFGVVGLASYTVGPVGRTDQQIEAVASAALYYLPSAIAGIVLGSWKLRQGVQRNHGLIAIALGVIGLVGLVLAVVRFSV
jgi:hypothetical protein